MYSFDRFCGNSSLWDESGFSDNSSFPEFTKCFRNSILIWIPCGWLWLTLPVNIYQTKTSKTPRIPVTAFNISKLILNIALVVLTIIDTVKAVSDEDLSQTVPNVMMVSGIINSLTFGLAAVYTQLDRIRGNITSVSLFVFWLLKVLCNIPEFYTKIIQHTYIEKLFGFILFYILYTIVFIQLILHCFAENPSVSDEISEHNQEMCPEGRSSVLNLLYFWWMNSIIMKAFRQSLEERDLWTLLPHNQSHHIVSKFDVNWRKELSKAHLRKEKEVTQHIYDLQQVPVSEEKTPLIKNHLVETVVKHSSVYRPSLFKAFCNSFGWTYLLALWFKFLSDILAFAGPLLISMLIDYANNYDTKPTWKGYLPAIGIFVAGIVQSVFSHQNYKLGFTVGMRIKCSLIAAIYKKALTMNNDAKRDTTLGQIVSLMSVDCQRLQDTFSYLWTIMSVPVQVVIGTYLLWNIVGISCLTGVAVLLLLVPINTVIGLKQMKLTVDALMLKGERIKLMNEILSGIKVLKMYAWEPSFQQKVVDIRERELNKLKSVAYLVGITTISWLLAPFLVSLATFATYVTLTEDHYLSASTAFVALALFNVLRIPINTLALTISSLIQAHVSLKRVSNFISGEDLDPCNVQHVFDTEYTIKIQRGNFTWNKDRPQSTLKDINITIPDGQLVAVVGQVGAGKSSLISAILGEMLKIDGSVSLKGSVAYVPQEAWIQNATLMDNILFGKTYLQKKYKRVLEACALTADLDILPGRDLTEIGEKGINISGGQKQRVSLARAVYSNSDVYLMDDPLSAVDVHVGKHIFEKVIGPKGLLKNKTRILVTHGIHWLPMVDNIIVMVNGKITEMGSYEELISHDGPFAQFLKYYLIEENNDDVDDPELQKIRTMILEQVECVTSDGMTSDEPTLTSLRLRRSNMKELGRDVRNATQLPNQIKIDRLTQDEESQTGGIKLKIYMTYLRAFGILTTIVVVMVFSFYHGFSIYANFWLTFWTNDPYLTNQTNIGNPEFYDKVKHFLLVYGLLGVVQAILVFVYAILASVRMVYAAGKIHVDLLDTVIRAPMAFFDTTPIGRIINRFSSDVDVLDVTLPLTFRITINSLYLAIATVIVICINTPVIFSVLFPVAIVYGLITIFYLPTSRQLKRLESVYRSPIYNHFSETVAGASVIRAYKATERFMEEALKRLDKNMVFYYAFVNAGRWLGVRLELLGNIIVIATALFSVFLHLDGALVGLSVVYAIQATYVLNLLVMNLSDLQSNIVCVERIKEYTEICTEGAWRYDRRPPKDWPIRGTITFNGYKMRYRTGTDLVLRGIDLKIFHNEKVGIVGRTGAGKSSMALALFRLVEASSGEIIIDGIKIDTIGLHDLREKITILPQDPVIFSGSLRLNLDPFGCYSDDQLWAVLEQAHLKDSVVALPGQLGHMCGESGQNLSVGQRQLVCLARALLKDTRILILDEATASVDLATDDIIQQTIFEEFQNCTVISIAHRLNTVLNYDRIIVMDKGQVRECDTPDNLLADEDSVFYSLAKEAGIISNGTNGNQERMSPSGLYQEKQGILPGMNDSDLIDTFKDDNGSGESSNGWTSYSGRSGNEGSAEFSNGPGYTHKNFIDSESMDSVRFGDVTIVTPQETVPADDNIRKNQITPLSIEIPQERQSLSDDVTPKNFIVPDETEQQLTIDNEEPLSNEFEGPFLENIPQSVLDKPDADDSSSNSDENVLSIKSLSSSEGKGTCSSGKSEYFTADSREDLTVIDKEQSSGEETLLDPSTEEHIHDSDH